MRIIFIDDINRMERFINISYYVNTGTGGMIVLRKKLSKKLSKNKKSTEEIYYGVN